MANYTPPAGVAYAAARGLKLRKEFNRGGTAVGLGRARQLSSGVGVPLSDIKKMYAYFERHAVDKSGKDWNNAASPSAGKIAWLLWGGDPGRSWATSIRQKATASGEW